MKYLFYVLFVTLALPAFGLENPTPDSISATDFRASAGPISLMTNREFWLSIIIMIFGLTIVLIQFFMMKGVVKQKTEHIANTNLVTLIIIGTLVLISSGFTSQQIAPALGLFGTIAGYILGKSEKDKE